MGCLTNITDIDEYVKRAKPNLGMKKIIDELSVRCMNNANPNQGKSRCECDWVGPLGDWDTHSKYDCQVQRDVNRIVKTVKTGQTYCITFPRGEPIGISMNKEPVDDNVIVSGTYYCVKDNKPISIIKEGDIIWDASNPFDLDSFHDFEGKSPAEVRNAISELKTKGDVTITFQDGGYPGKYQRRVCMYKSLNKDYASVQGQLEEKNQEICALKQDAARKVQGMSDKYHETLDSYRKLMENHTALQAELEGKKTKFVHSNDKWREKVEVCQVPRKKDRKVNRMAKLT